MKKATVSQFCAGIIFLILCSCQSSDNIKPGVATLVLPETPFTYDSLVSNNDYIPTLGRVLFYDQRLSINNSVSCSSCHKQELAFADRVSFSPGMAGKPSKRNSMPLQNLVNNSGLVENGFSQNPLSLFWDGREKVLGTMVLQPIVNHVEMGVTDLNALTEKLSGIPEYQQLYIKAFGVSDITQDGIGTALSAFLMNLTSVDTKLDRSIAGRDQFNAEESAGFNLFMSKYNCNSCHQTQTPNGYQNGGGDPDTQGFINIGLDQEYTDVGLADVTNLSTDVGKFKIPTLRNVALTAPYMHDGRFKTLDEVLDHYSGNIANHPNLDERLKVEGAPIRMNIPDADRLAIIAFLNTMTDAKLSVDVRFSNPFVIK